ncbi:Crp/Fnr family transcriptional regulator [Deinococcus peraridilitoris]|uniref:cAMP-binding protein n=1 Tax=Deinococcus peraridilitoris (strain DSM 19664 / LMG 22246 / CIP 109416 / KR-200) TaxID=937777 RepID=L0A3X9_DEIPD|nr:Crp/Fnr family transcriptional regulator [Deinococcus peraridilitoris]AFZ68588.1 cAMP-binding protein [Deinococcus peraridilitoris DSM 19664]
MNEGPGHKRRYQRSEAIYRQGEPAKRIFLAETGFVRLYQATPRGRALTVRHVLPGDYFGESTFVDASGDTGVYSHSAEALTGALVASFDLNDLSEAELLSVSCSLSAQLRRAMNFSVHLQSGDLKQRVVRYMLELADTPLGAEDAEDRLYIRATHELLAEGSASTRESVSKIVTELREAGLIESGYRHIILLDLSGLQKLASHGSSETHPR